MGNKITNNDVLPLQDDEVDTGDVDDFDYSKSKFDDSEYFVNFIPNEEKIMELEIQRPLMGFILMHEEIGMDIQGEEDGEEDTISNKPRTPLKRIVIPRNRSISNLFESPTSLLTPITPRFGMIADNIFDFNTNEINDFSNDENYGFLPTEALHKILQYLEPSDLIKAFQTCKLVYNISSTSSFWKEYYKSFFKDEDRPTSPDELHEPYSYKKRFFDRYYFLTDYFYLTQYRFVEENEEKVDLRKIRIGIVGRSCDSICTNFLECLQKVSKNFRKPDDVSTGVQLSTTLTRLDISNIFYDLDLIHVKNDFEMGVEHMKLDGVILCFSSDNRYQFDAVKKIYESDISNLYIHTTKKTVFLLAGMGREGHKETEEEEQEIQSGKIVGYEEAVGYVKVKKLLGYIEWDWDRNVFLCLGVLLDGIVKRLKLQKKLFTDLDESDSRVQYLSVKREGKVYRK